MNVRICIGCSVTFAAAFASVTDPPVSVVSCICCASPSHAANQAGRSTVASCERPAGSSSFENRCCSRTCSALYYYIIISSNSYNAIFVELACKIYVHGYVAYTVCGGGTSNVSSCVVDAGIGESQMRGGNGLQRRSEPRLVRKVCRWTLGGRSGITVAAVDRAVGADTGAKNTSTGCCSAQGLFRCV